MLGTGGFEWDEALVEAFLRGPMRGPVSPPNNTGDGLRMAMAHGADLANMGEAWWVPIIQIPGDTFDGKPRSRSVRLERTRPRSIIVNRAGKRFLNEAGEYNSMAGPFHHLDPRHGYLNDPAWIVFDSQHLKRYGFLGVDPDGPSPTGSASRGTLPSWARRQASTRKAWPAHCRRGTKTSPTSRIPTSAVGQVPTTGTGATTTPRRQQARRSAPSTRLRITPSRVTVGAMGTKGGPRTDPDGRVMHVSGAPIPGLFAAGNAMAGATGKAYGGAGGTIGPAMVFGFRAGNAVAART